MARGRRLGLARSFATSQCRERERAETSTHIMNKELYKENLTVCRSVRAPLSRYGNKQVRDDTSLVGVYVVIVVVVSRHRCVLRNGNSLSGTHTHIIKNNQSGYSPQYVDAILNCIFCTSSGVINV